MMFFACGKESIEETNFLITSSGYGQTCSKLFKATS